MSAEDAGVSAALPHKDAEGAKIGMWLFLLTEIILFGGLFLLYSAYRSRYPHEFHHAGGDLNAVIGVVNTLILLTSSLTMALSTTAIRKGDRPLAAALVYGTAGLGTIFLLNKAFEWWAHISHGIYPNGPELLKLPSGEIIFYGLYYTMTGLHGLHVLIGIILMTALGVMIQRGRLHGDDCVLLDNSGLYWHLVDVIWIFLLPLFYLAA